jgi:hypothetical protein
MATESGDAKLLGNFSKLIEFVSLYIAQRGHYLSCSGPNVGCPRRIVTMSPDGMSHIAA